MKILAATDGSRAGEAAVRFASQLLGDSGRGSLVVLTVEADGEPPLRAKGRLPADHGNARRVVARARHADDVPEVISREADRIRADMIVVGSEGRDSLEEWVVGGTALRLIYVSRRPVTVVRAPRKRTVR